VSPLGGILARRIRESGPLTVADYMGEALGHPEHGYYATRDPFGRRGDFITAPEISQMFGELVGLWAATVWESLGRPPRIVLAELGPGRGTLMADALRAAKVWPDFAQSVELHLIETSPVLRRMQAEMLGAATPTWHDDFDSLPEGPLLVVANEFLDALPIHQLVRTGEGWRERLVTVDPEGDGLTFAVAAGETKFSKEVPLRFADAPEGSIFEVNPGAVSIAVRLAMRLASGGGAALFIDYGHFLSACGDTLQAVRNHQRHDVLAEPGTADITAHVDFGMLADALAAGGAAVHGPITQGSFLRALGIERRAETLLARATPAQATDISIALGRLIGGDQMGTLFKVLTATQPGLPPPPGFA
jgi:NADH dehydrogenase [ubiquinone] 1 alpha subcomplex assembly factor 7